MHSEPFGSLDDDRTIGNRLREKGKDDSCWFSPILRLVLLDPVCALHPEVNDRSCLELPDFPARRSMVAEASSEGRHRAAGRVA